MWVVEGACKDKCNVGGSSVFEPWLLYLQGKIVAHALELVLGGSIWFCQGNLLEGSILVIACTLTVSSHNLQQCSGLSTE